MSCFWCKPANLQWSICSMCLCVTDPVFSNVNPLVCLTFQWCSGNLNSIFCWFSQRWGCPRQGESRQQQQAQQQPNKVWSSSCIRQNLCRNSLSISTDSPPLLLPWFGICFSDACGSSGDVSDLSLGRGAVSGQTAHQGDWQVLGRERAFHFSPLGLKVAHCSLNSKIFQRAFFLDKSQRVMM